jgi:imidazoleglycerol-phosphate dehydratase
VKRKTAETDIAVSLGLDGSGSSKVSTGVGFLDHMLDLFARHGQFDLEVRAQGDLHIDPHHTVEDVGICLGRALDQAVGDKAGIRRYGDVTLPMDETLATVAVDLGGRPYVVWKAEIPTEKIGSFDSQLVEEFWRAVAMNAHMNLHVIVHYGGNSHHIAESIFKATARAISAAVQIDPRVRGIPSTKGTL